MSVVMCTVKSLIFMGNVPTVTTSCKWQSKYIKANANVHTSKTTNSVALGKPLNFMPIKKNKITCKFNIFF